MLLFDKEGGMEFDKWGCLENFLNVFYCKMRKIFFIRTC